jgi:Mitochondrial ribosomal protein subunit
MSKATSPAANLLRASRVFSIPPPIARELPELQSTGASWSESSTTPYPTHAALATTPSSLGRGDWGLKRPLPLKSTARATTTPTFRIKAIDNFEQITDFESAADHVLTLKKWQEFNIPLSQEAKRKSAVGSPSMFSSAVSHRSVFEEDTDQTQAKPGNQRWKFNTPWLANMNDGDFSKYLDKVASKKKGQFRAALTDALKRRKAVDMKRMATEEGKVADQATLEAITITEEEYHTHIRSLRSDPKRLDLVLREFLDIPTELSPSSTSSIASAYFVSGPPLTHPSAGLSYLRSNATLPNHPLLGPQASLSSPVESRVITTLMRANGSNSTARFGVGGVVAESQTALRPNHKGRNWAQNNLPNGVAMFNPTIKGGAKMWVHPKRATIDSKGRVQLEIEKAEDSTIGIADGSYLVEQEDTGPVPAVEPAFTSPGTSRWPSMPSMGARGSSLGGRGAGGYGIAREVMGRKPASQVQQVPDKELQAAYDDLKTLVGKKEAAQSGSV